MPFVCVFPQLPLEQEQDRTPSPESGVASDEMAMRIASTLAYQYTYASWRSSTSSAVQVNLTQPNFAELSSTHAHAEIPYSTVDLAQASTVWFGSNPDGFACAFFHVLGSPSHNQLSHMVKYGKGAPR